MTTFPKYGYFLNFIALKNSLYMGLDIGFVDWFNVEIKNLDVHEMVHVP